MTFPDWSKVWVWYLEGDGWHFATRKEDIPNQALACEYMRNNDPFRCEIVKSVVERSTEEDR